MRCLVIEDEEQTSRYVAKGLREAGYTVTVCDDGEQGLDHAIGAEWDIMVIDRMLPGRIDGLSLVARLRREGRRTPIIILSALTGIDERVSGLRGGADDYLSKPFAFSELLARIEALLRRVSPELDGGKIQVADLTLDMRALRATRSGKATR